MKEREREMEMKMEMEKEKEYFQKRRRYFEEKTALPTGRVSVAVVAVSHH